MAKLGGGKNYRQTENDFQKAQESYWNNKDKKSWDKMFLLIKDCCFNIIGKLTNYVLTIDEQNEKATDITIIIMERLKRGNGEKRIGRLSSYCYLDCKAIFKPQKQFEDKCLSWDELTEQETLDIETKVIGVYN